MRIRTNQDSIAFLIFLIYAPPLISVLLAILDLTLPTEMTVYLFILCAMFILCLQRGNVVLFIPYRAGLLYLGFTLLVYSYYTFVSVSIDVAESKIILFIYLIVVKILLLCCLDHKKIATNICVFYKQLGYISSIVLMLLGTLFVLGFNESPDTPTRSYLIGIGNPIWASRFVADLLFCAIYCFAISKYSSRIGYIILFIAIAFSLYMLFKSGSRGPVLALLVSLIFSFSSIYYSHKKLIFAIFGILALVLIPLALPLVMDFNLFSLLARLEHVRVSFDIISQGLSGHGVGSYGVLIYGVDELAYPHNVFLELLIECGLLGFLCYSYFIIRVFKTTYKGIFFYLFLMSFINAQVSGDIPGNSMMFVYGFLSLMYASIFYRQRQSFQ